MARVWSWACVWVWAAVFALLFSKACGRGGIKGEPRVTGQWQTRKVVREGDFVKLLCPITANPEPLYDWFKDGEAVKATWKRYNTKKNVLKIKPAFQEDAGYFTCVGVNGFGTVNSSMSLIVLGEGEPEGELMEPQLTQVWPESPLHRRRGEHLVLSCQARGLPTPIVTWYKDGLSLSREGEQLTFDALLTTDSGHYTCRANSALGGKTANFTLQVGERSEDHDLEISEAVNTTVVEGGTTSLQCTVRTSHPPRVQWLKEITADEAGDGGAQLPNSTQKLGGRWFRKVEGVGRVVARGDSHYLSKLTISRATPHVAGVYVCLAVNTLGFSFREAHLTVLHREAGTQYPPVGQKERSVNWLFLIIPAVVVIIVVVAVVLCQIRKTSPDKPVGVTPPTPVLKGGDDASGLTPLNPDSHNHHALPRPPDLVYQEVSGYPGGSLRSGQTGGLAPGGGGGGGSGHYTEHYPSPYPESYIDPAYSDPYSGERGPTRTSDHSYARLTHPSHPSHPSLASHTSHASHASSSPHLPPPYAHTHGHSHAHSHAHSHRHPQYFVHYNL
ncbi:fibroblast growth factor receptor-like 1 [Homarus americanus]|uniref:fibroblast growth factor receptor-like 1 n=1 Tax=Homarus americanus TaxID=6706 RepID=UPI001C48D2F0|nr:fibroblast growth factor receptor-like 1 [Homarus americanus]XP_042221941.1 fibroblast growth factor receptor-like 1 [Homarus americanus]